jgi:hypothetical protein
MELRNARLCLDCEEVHGEAQCPVCGSETFTFITRWIPAAEGRRRPRPTTSQEADLYKQLISPEQKPSRGGRLLKQGVVGLTALSLAGLFWGSREARKEGRPPGGNDEPEG